jgi:hypothetical protein
MQNDKENGSRTEEGVLRFEIRIVLQKDAK